VHSAIFVDDNDNDYDNWNLEKKLVTDNDSNKNPDVFVDGTKLKPKLATKTKTSGILVD